MSWYRRPSEFVNTNYQEKTKTPVVATQSGKQLVFLSATVNNRSGGAIIAGLGFKISDTRWSAGQWDDSGNPEFIDDTTDAQDSGADDFALTTLTDDDGFAVQSLDKFGIVGVTVTTAANDGTFAYTYWNGSSYATLTLIETPDWTSTGEKTIAFAPPVDWAVNSGQAVTDGLTAGYYSIRVIATTAPTVTAALASLLWVARLYDYKEDVSDNAVLNIIPEDANRGIVLQGGESIVPYFGTANANNSISVRYTIRG